MIGGYGPWFCALFQKMDDSQIIVHTLPHLALLDLGPEWRLKMKVGPFECWENAVRYSEQWKYAAASKHEQFFEKGMELFERNWQEQRLCLWRVEKDEDPSIKPARGKRGAGRGGKKPQHQPDNVIQNGQVLRLMKMIYNEDGVATVKMIAGIAKGK